MVKIPRSIIRFARHPLTLATAAQLAFRLGKDAYRVKKGEIDVKEFRARSGKHMGTLSGGLAGAWVGAAAGTAVAPGVGTLVGAFAGGMVGENLGGKAARGAMEKIETLVGDEESEEPKGPEPPKRSL